MRLRGVVAAIALGVGSAQAQVAGAPASDAAVVSLGVDDVAPGSGAASLSAEWVRLRSGNMVRAGVETVSGAGVHWVLARGGAAWRPTPRVTVEGGAALGPGSEAGAGFLYRHLRAGATYAATPGRVFLDAAGTTFDIGAWRGQVFTGGATVVPHHRVAARLAYGHSVGGNYDTEYLLVRADLQLDRFGTLGGISFGGAGPTRDDFHGDADPSSRREAFAGVRVPLREMELTLVVSHLWGGGVRRDAVVLGSRIPLR